MPAAMPRAARLEVLSLAMPEIGQLIDRYVVEAVLGEGGMGRVYRAMDPRLGRRVALKVLLARGASEADRAVAAARMVREARSAAGFNHPNVVAIYDVGEVGGSPFIAMELIEGASLRAYVSDPSVTNEQRLHWLLDVARGLDAAHRTGLVHRDIKPDNVMITPDGVVKILDFGIARRTQSEVVGTETPTEANMVSLTSEGQTLGTPQYMSPEQLQAGLLDGGTDQFAWGVMAWELFAGKLPWGASKNGAQLIAAVLSMPVAPLHSIVPSVDLRFSNVVERALAKKRADRFATMGDLVAAMGMGRMSGAPTPSVRGAPTPSVRNVAFEPTERLESTRDPRAGSRAAARTPAPASGSAPGVAVLTTAAPLSARATAAGEPKLASPTRRWGRVGALAGVCVVLAGGAAFLVEQKAARVSLCAELGITETGLFDSSKGPRCARVLAPDALAARFHSNRVLETGGHVRSVERVTFAGARVDVGDTKTDVTYASDGSVLEVVSHDAQGNLTEWQKWSDGGRRIDFVDDDGATPRHAMAARITGVRREYDGRGFVTRETYVGPTGRPRLAPRVAYGLAYSAWDHDHWARITYLAADGKPGLSALFGAAEDRTASDEPVITRDARYLDLDGRPMPDYAGVFREHFEGDTSLGEGSGTVVFFGNHENHVVHRFQGEAGFRWRWDPAKRQRELNLIDGNGRLLPRRGDSWFTLLRTYDARGRRVLTEHLDDNRNLVPSRDPQLGSALEASEREVWNDRNDLVETIELDARGALTQNGDGFARREQAFDEHGRPVEARYYDEAGHLAPRRDGGVIWRTTYDDRGLVVAEASFDAENHPVANVRGYAVTRNKYDRLRNLVEVARFGTDGHPCVDERGVSIERSKYDDNDDLVEVTYLNADGAPVMLGGEYATRRMKNDERGLVVEEEYLDGHGGRASRRDGYAAIRYVRDRNDDVVEESYFGKHDEPKVGLGGYAKKKTAYDAHREPVEVSLFGTTGAPQAGSDGWAIERSTYDETGLLVRRDHLDAGSHPVPTKSGAASTTMTYDDRGNLTVETALGVDGSPVVMTDGYATKKSGYNERDELVSEALFGADGAPATCAAGWSSRQRRYDDLGQLVEEAFFDGEHHPVAPKGLAYTSMLNRYDARQRLIEVGYFDADGVPAKGPDGTEKVHYQRDAYGRATETAYLDGANAPMASKDGKIVIRTKYDEAGRPLEEQFLDGTGAPHVANDGCAAHRTKYSLVGRKLEESCLDEKGAPTVNQDGWAIRRTIYDARGNAVDTATYGSDGTLRTDSEGVARRRSRFDERSLLRDTTFFDAADKPTHDKRGRSGIELTYDENGTATGERPR